MNQVKYLQNELLQIYEAIRRICDKHHIRYYASGGTALGAIRHKGFIPWDDDLDLEMPRSDYERFCGIVESELPDDFRFVHFLNTYGYDYLFAKVVCCDKERVNRVEKETGVDLTQGLYVDIFPTDYFPKSKATLLGRLVKRGLVKVRAWYLLGRLANGTAKERIEAFIGMLLPPWRSASETYWGCVKTEDRIVSSCPEEDAATMGGNCWAQREWMNFIGKRKLVPDDFAETILQPFEGTTIPVVRNYERYLTVHYGDWRKLPPEEKRVPAHSNGEIAPWRYGFTHIEKRPMLSIVVANFNYEKYIEATLKSVVSQCWGVAKGPDGQTVLGLPNGESIELIVVDGGSTDGSVEIIRKYASRLTWWCSEKDKGQSDAFNKGYTHATGKYLTWVNADDLMVPGCLVKVTNQMRKHPDCEWFTGNFFRFLNSSGKVIQIGWGPHYYPFFLQWKNSPIVAFGPSTFFSRKIYDMIGGFDVRLRNSMDWMAWIKFVQAGVKQRRVRTMCWAFRMHEASKTAEFDGHQRDQALVQRGREEAELRKRETGYRASRLNYYLMALWRVVDFSLLWRFVLELSHKNANCFFKGEKV